MKDSLKEKMIWTYRFLWQTLQIHSVPRTLYSLQFLQTLARHILQKAPRFMMRPSSARQRAHARLGSGAHIMAPLEDPLTAPALVSGCEVASTRTVAPRRFSCSSSARSRLQSEVEK